MVNVTAQILPLWRENSPGDENESVRMKAKAKRSSRRKYDFRANLRDRTSSWRWKKDSECGACFRNK